MKSFSDILDNTRWCPLCNRILTLIQCSEHVRLHLDKEHNIKSVYIPFDKKLFLSNPNALYVCIYCGCIPPATLVGNPTTEIAHHIERGDCPACPPKHVSLTFRVILNKEAIKEIVDNYPLEKKVDILFCPEKDEGFHRIDDLIEHYIVKHLSKPTKSQLLEEQKQNRLPEQISAAIEELNDIPLATTGKIPYHLPHKIPYNIKTFSVPHQRSVLKRLAGIDDSELSIAVWDDAEHEKADEFIEPPKSDETVQGTLTIPARSVKKELTYTNILHGHIHLTKDIASLLADALEQIELCTEDGKQFIGDIRRDQRLILIGPELSDWFEANGLFAGCYLYLYAGEKGRIEIAYSPVSTSIKRCLKATWDQNELRVILKYEDVEVMAECSEHLFRSSVNLDDPRVLNYMARLHGSVFDVLYLGMRDLVQAGYETIHYRDLHNMVIDKRLHPQLGSVFMELRKNQCFKKLGGGYWAFEPDSRIERILPDVLIPQQEDNLKEVEANFGNHADKQDTIKRQQEEFMFAKESNKENEPTSTNVTSITSKAEPVLMPESEPSPDLEDRQLILIESKETIDTGRNKSIQQEENTRLPKRIKLQIFNIVTSLRIFLKNLCQWFLKTFFRIRFQL